VVTILTEDGMVSRYLYGLEYKPLDVRLALLEASKGKIGNTVDRIILYCCRYDPDAKGYVAMASRIMTLGGGVTLILLAIVLGTFWVRERTSHPSQNGT
jgi:protein SCO1